MSNSGNRAVEIVADVLEAPEEERSAVLNLACAGDTVLRAEAQRLLGLGPKLKGFLEGLDLTQEELSRAASAGESERHPAGGVRFGRYRALRLIGEGGMGSVYEAEQAHPRRHVALKVIKLGMDTKQVIGR